MTDRGQLPDGSACGRRRFLAAAAATVGVLMDGRAVEGAGAGRRVDVAVVGGGPAGLSAALVLGRACLRALVVDGGPGRNAPAPGVHGFLGQDGTPPAELRRVGREQLRPYDVAVEAGEVVAARRLGAEGFELDLGPGGRVECRRLILATGMVDVLPDIPGFRERWGDGVIHCPYCHGWETRGRPWAFLAPDAAIEEVGALLSGWTRALTCLADGAPVGPERRAWLAARGIALIEEKIAGLDGPGSRLAAIRFDGGRRLEVPTLFARVPTRQRSPLAEALGAELVKDGWNAGTIRADGFGATTVAGLFVAGDASGAGLPSVASAVAQGAAAAAAASRALIMAAAGGP